MERIQITIRYILVLLLIQLVGVWETEAQENHSLASVYSGMELEEGSSAYRIPLNQVLDNLEEQYRVTFLYQDRVMEDQYVEMRESELNEMTGKKLSEILSALDLNYSKLNNYTFVISQSDIPLVAFQETITGTITDAATGESLPGVNITIQGTDQGTASSIDGTYELVVPTLNDTLVFSYVGYQSQTVPINGQTTVDVELAMDVFQADDIVVVGYGTQSRETLSGAVSSVPGRRMEQIPVTNMANSLTGQLPGIVTVNQSGEPGFDGALIRIRGESTLNDNRPLIVIDGVPDRAGGLDRINPRDVENISVLKDASAAIYGSRAANGVILITTKRGRAGAPQFSLDLNQGFNQPSRVPDMADAATYMTMLNEIDMYRDTEPRYSQQEIQCHAEVQDPWLCPDTDWFAEALKPVSYQTRADMSVSGGTDNFRYYLSFSGLTEDGFYENSATRYDEYSFRSNLDGQLTDNVSLSVDLLGRFEDRNFPTESAGATFRMLMRGKPNEHGFWPNGLPAPDIENGTNPVVTGTDATGYDRDDRYLFQSNVKLRVEVPNVEGLSFTGTAVFDKDFRNRKRWQTPWTLYDLAGFDTNGDGEPDGMDTSGTPIFNESLVPNQDARLEQWSDEGQNTLVNLLANYEQDFEDHSVSLLLGTERQKIQNAGIYAFRRFFPTTQIDQLSFGGEEQQNIEGGSSSLGDNISRPNEAIRQNFFTRINYNYQSKYLFELVARYDGSYIFPEGSRYGFFPSASVGWRLTQEDWFQDFTSFFDELKLRASYGQTGNDRIEEWQFMSTYQFGAGYVFNNTANQSIYPARTPNPDVSWEVSNQFDVGIESSMFDDRLSLEVDYFNELRTDILWFRNASVPQTAGINLPRENIGEVKAWGFDGSIGWREQFGTDFWLDVSLNGGFATNEIKFWDEPPGAPKWQQSTGSAMTIDGNGNDYGLMYDVIGVFRDEAHVNSMPHWDGARPGDLIFRDVNEDGQIDANDRIRTDRTGVPKWNGGLNISGQYRAFDFVILFQGAAGASQWVQTQSGDFGNYLSHFADQRWTPDNPDASGPRAFQREEEYWINQRNNYFYMDTDYLRLKNMEIGYNLPPSLTTRLGINRMRIYANGFNLITWSDFPLDPEARNASGSYYPQKRVFNLGLSLGF